MSNARDPLEASLGSLGEGMTAHADGEVSFASDQDAQTVGMRMGGFLVSARLLEETCAARDAAESALHRLQAIERTSRAIAEAGLDVEGVLRTVARELADVIGEGCVIRTLSPDGTRSVHRATWHRDPELCALGNAEPLTSALPGDVGFLGEVRRVGGRVVVPIVDRDAFLAQYEGTGLAELLAPSVPTTLAALPLIARGRAFGLVLLLRHEQTKPYDEAELALAEEIAARAALAIDNAALHAEAMRAASERTEALEREREVSRAKDEFLAMLGHELRNPLAPILSILQLRRARAEGSPAREDATLERQARHLAHLVDDLLDVARIASGKLTISPERICLADVIETAVEMARPLIDARGQVLSLSLAKGLWLEADEHRLAQVISNVLGNAAKYTPPSGRLWLSARREDARIVIRIEDDGAGVDSALLPRLFEPFVQGAQKVDRAVGGLGLGLSIVKQIVGLHGGTVHAYSDGKGRGTQVVIELPAAEPGLVCATELRRPARAFTPRRVLVVDDNRDSAEALREILETVGHVVSTAHDAATAIELAQIDRPEVALLDIGMPDVDGYELARRIRAIPELAGIRLVAVTGYGQPSDRRNAQEAGFDAHVVKPVDIDRLRGIVAADGR